MQLEYLDISAPIEASMPTWPGSSGITLTRVQDIRRGDPVNESDLAANLHVGTHVDAPLHFLANGAPVDRLAIDAMIGPATVATLEGCKDVTADDLEALSLPPSVTRLLLKTPNSKRWSEGGFVTDYVALSPGAASWLVDHGITLVGIDYLSIERYRGSGDVHRILLGAGVIVVEGLKLDDVEPGDYELACLPLRLVGAEGAPARAVLMRERAPAA